MAQGMEWGQVTSGGGMVMDFVARVGTAEVWSEETGEAPW